MARKPPETRQEILDRALKRIASKPRVGSGPVLTNEDLAADVLKWRMSEIVHESIADRWRREFEIERIARRTLDRADPQARKD